MQTGVLSSEFSQGYLEKSETFSAAQSESRNVTFGEEKRWAAGAKTGSCFQTQTLGFGEAIMLSCLNSFRPMTAGDHSRPQQF